MRKAFLKYTLLAASVICAAVLLSSCRTIYVSENNNPSVALREFCGYISDGDYKAAFELTGCKADISPSDMEKSLEGALLARISQSISITPLSEPEVNGTSAWQSVEISHIDMRLAIKKLLAGVMEETSSYEWKHGSYKTDEDIAEAVYESLRSQLGGDLSDCTITERVKLRYRCKKGKWAPVMTKELYNALTGYASEAAENIDSFFTEYHPDNAQHAQTPESE